MNNLEERNYYNWNDTIKNIQENKTRRKRKVFKKIIIKENKS